MLLRTLKCTGHPHTTMATMPQVESPAVLKHALLQKGEKARRGHELKNTQNVPEYTYSQRRQRLAAWQECPTFPHLLTCCEKLFFKKLTQQQFLQYSRNFSEDFGECFSKGVSWHIFLYIPVMVYPVLFVLCSV